MDALPPVHDLFSIAPLSKTSPCLCRGAGTASAHPELPLFYGSSREPSFSFPPLPPHFSGLPLDHFVIPIPSPL